MSRAAAMLLLLLLVAVPAVAQTTYRPGFYRLAIEAEFLGRVRIDAAAPAVGDDGTACGVVHEVTVVESIVGAGAGEKLRFVAAIEPGGWPVGANAFAMLFAHEVGDGPGRVGCWFDAAPLFAAHSPASVVPFDPGAGTALGGEFLPVRDNLLAGLRFAAFEIVLDGRGGHFASWELVRAYARQTPAARKAVPLAPELPDDPGPLAQP